MTILIEPFFLFLYLQLKSQIKNCYGDPQMLYSALSAMKEKNSQLENSLSSETKVKMDLFSALGDTRRQLEQRDIEVEELKRKLAEVMAGFSLLYSPHKFLPVDQTEHPLDLEVSKNSIENSSSNADWNDLKRKTLLDLNSSTYTSSNGVQSDL